MWTVRSATKETEAAPSSKNQNSSPNIAINFGIAALWLGLLGYCLFLAPNQTPFRDSILVKLLLNLSPPDPSFPINPVIFSLWNLMGVYPLIFSCLLVPAGRSDNKVPAWPFCFLSFFFGAFALLPYFALWQPQDPQPQLPPRKEELDGWNRVVMKGAETPFLPAGLVAAAAYLVYSAVTASPEAWLGYLQFFDESRLIHATSIDFATLTALAPFWMYNDAAARNWEPRDKVLPFLSVLPVVGPALYLLLRPKTDLSS